MERQSKPLQLPLPSHRRGRSDNPSFSSSLLDAIYRSIDEKSDDNGGETTEVSCTMLHNKCQDSIEFRRSKPVVIERPVNRVNDVTVHYHYHSRSSAFNNFTRNSYSSSSSSAGSSYRGGFFSSTSSEASQPVRSDRVRPDSTIQQPGTKKKKKKKLNCDSIRSRLRDLRRPRDASATEKAGPMSPASPGAKLASFLNALFTAAGNAKKTKVATTAATASVEGAKEGNREESCSSSSPSSSTRPCLSKTPPSLGRRERGKRSVRFYPVSVIVDEDCRPCGHRGLQDESKPTGSNVETVAASAMTAMTARVEELLGGKEEEMEEDGDGKSDASSDLFELDNWTLVGGMIGGYSNELPVYETTDVGTNRAIAQCLI